MKCKCGHGINMHDIGGCHHVDSIAGVCPCYKTPAEIIYDHLVHLQRIKAAARRVIDQYKKSGRMYEALLELEKELDIDKLE